MYAHIQRLNKQVLIARDDDGTVHAYAYTRSLCAFCFVIVSFSSKIVINICNIFLNQKVISECGQGLT